MKEPYHYIESGLDNVYLYNLPEVQDIQGEGVIYIPRINQLHRVIAQGIINKNGLLNCHEIRFLRTEMEMKQSEFSNLLGKEAQACGRWERNECPVDKTTDTLIRILTAKIMDIPVNIEKIPELNQKDAANDNINIDGSNEIYTLMSATAI